MIIDRRLGRQYDIDDAITRDLIDKSALDQYRPGTLSITEFADMQSGNMSGSRSRSSSLGSSSSYPMSPVPTIKTPAKKLEKQLEDEMKKAKALQDEKDRLRKLMEEERKKLQAVVDEALRKQREAEAEMKNKQREMDVLEQKQQERERLLGDENKKLREELQNMEIAIKM